MLNFVARSVQVAILIGLAAGTAHGAETGPVDATFIIDAGGFFLSTDTRLRVNGETSDAIGSDIDFEDTFGIGDTDRFRIDARWRISQRHSIRGMYFENNRSAGREIEREIQFGDETFPIGVGVSARSELRIAQLSYDYAFLSTPCYEVAAGLGLHMLDAEFGLAAELTASGGSVSRQVDEGAATRAPLPVVGLRGLWRLGNRFYATAAAQYFYVEFNGYSGTLADLTASVVWDVTRYVGIGVGYNDFQIRVDIEDEGNFDGRLRWSYGGALAFLSVKF